MKKSKATLNEVREAIKKACVDRSGVSPEELLGSMGWTVQEYKIALIDPSQWEDDK